MSGICQCALPWCRKAADKTIAFSADCDYTVVIHRRKRRCFRRGQTIFLFFAPGMWILSLSSRCRPGELQLPVLLLPSLSAGAGVRRSICVSPQRKQGLHQLSLSPSERTLRGHHPPFALGAKGVKADRPLRHLTQKLRKWYNKIVVV